MLRLFKKIFNFEKEILKIEERIRKEKELRTNKEISDLAEKIYLIEISKPLHDKEQILRTCFSEAGFFIERRDRYFRG